MIYGQLETKFTQECSLRDDIEVLVKCWNSVVQFLRLRISGKRAFEGETYEPPMQRRSHPEHILLECVKFASVQWDLRVLLAGVERRRSVCDFDPSWFPLR